MNCWYNNSCKRPKHHHRRSRNQCFSSTYLLEYSKRLIFALKEK